MHQLFLRMRAHAHVQCLEHIIRHKLIPALTGILAINDSFRDLLSLPAHMGGMGIAFPSYEAKRQYHNPIHILSPLIQAIINHSSSSTSQEKKEISTTRHTLLNTKLSELKESFAEDDSLLCCLELAREKGASSWLTARPIKEHCLPSIKVPS